MRSSLWLLLVLACDGGSGGDPDAATSRDSGVADVATNGGSMSATLVFGDREIIYQEPATFIGGQLCSCNGDDEQEVNVSVAWLGSRADATGTFPIDGNMFLIAHDTNPYAKYQLSDGTISIDIVEPGRIAGTFSAAMASMTAHADPPPPEGERLRSITTGSFECRGPTSGPEAACFQ